MTTLVLADYLADLSTPSPGPIAEAVELRLKWVMDAYGEWVRFLVWRDGNTEYPICPVADPDFIEHGRTKI